jgi:GT2 family glycosyltransferase
MASAVLLYPGDEKRIQFIQSTLFRNIAGQARAHENELLSDAHRRIFDVDFVPACAIMLRPQALREVGMFDETLFTNWEDYDICCRFADAGWKIITTGTAEVVHAHGQTTGRTSPFITYLFTRNRLICLFRYGDPKAILLRSPHILRHFYWQMKAYGLSNWASHKAFFTGVADFMLGVRGMGHVPSDRRDRPAKSRSAG